MLEWDVIQAWNGSRLNPNGKSRVKRMTKVFRLRKKYMRYSLFTTVVLSLGSIIAQAGDGKPASTAKICGDETAQGFVSIFNGKSLDGWVGLGGDTSSYYVKDSQLICKKTGKVHIFTKKEYGNFILRFQFKLDPGANNGVGIRTKVHAEPHIYGMEIQVIEEEYYKDGDPFKLKDYQHHGSIYGVVPSKPGHLKPAGQWNDEEIVCNGRRVTVKLNGVVIVDANLDKVRPLDHQEHPGLKYKKGHIGLHAHGNRGAEVFFRKICVKELKQRPSSASDIN